MFQGRDGPPSWSNPFDVSAVAAQDPRRSPDSPSGGQHRGESNALATLSVVFAVVFAPAGAVLGHLGLSQIARTGQPGRDRALVGLTLSYVVIVTAVVSLVVWAALGENPAPTVVARPPPLATTTSVSSTAPPAPTTTPPPPPTAAPADALGLLLPVEETRALFGDPGVQVAEADGVPTDPPAKSQFDPRDCVGAFWGGAAVNYTFPYLRWVSANHCNDKTDEHLVQFVTVFANATGAQQAHRSFVDTFGRCSGAHFTWTIPSQNRRGTYTIGPISDAGGITTSTTTYDGHAFAYLHAVAVKANVLVEVWAGKPNGPGDQHVEAVRRILDRIPG